MTNQLVFVSALFFILQTPPMAEPPGVPDALRQAKTEQEMDRVIADFNQSNLNLIQNLSSFLNEAKSQESKVRACFLLGEIRNPRATRVLLDNLFVEADVPTQNTRIPLWGRYPCQDALAKIGKPTEHTLLELLSSSASDQAKNAALKILQHIEGWRGAVFVLEQAWERAGLEERKGLEKALQQAKKEAGI